MPAIVFYFQVHQPFRFRPYTVFDLGVDHLYENAETNRSILRKVAEHCYLPANTLLLSLIKAWKGAFKVSFSISGTALDQFEAYAPEVIDSFKRLAKTGCVEFIGETYSHSLSFLFSPKEFAEQVHMHRQRIQDLFGVTPVTFRNTELIYNNDLARTVEDMGFEAVLAEGADHLLGWRSPNYMYQPVNCHKIRLLLRNHRLSDDIAFRFSDQSWAGFPLTADTYAAWLHSLDNQSEVINLFMDYETFGEHHHEDTGIFAFLEALPGAVLDHGSFSFMTPSQAARTIQPVAKLDVPQYVSWADAERDLTAWLGNDMQLDAVESLYRLEDRARSAGDDGLLRVWRRLQTSDHFYYMSTKWLSDGEVHSYFNPYGSPYDAYINFMNVLADFETTLAEQPAQSARPARQTPAVDVPAAASPAAPKAPARKRAPQKKEADVPAAETAAKPKATARKNGAKTGARTKKSDDAVSTGTADKQPVMAAKEKSPAASGKRAKAGEATSKESHPSAPVAIADIPRSKRAKERHVESLA